ncbi:glycosyl hydrolase-related protein [Paenibacillus glycanilyticus]|uniref:alpha-mannosidase n=1 Tax=Paenibacillus glycanilyticus TaxID=126569 RepID=UPI00203C9C3C|nr:glycoside hydrolase family 38 C-terminal domain-containing protein [Paenibacillus glycanilyticus]MCM3628718.1 glycosyl hydrolase-related protein [Paenibacillus glycanilyticus]
MPSSKRIVHVISHTHWDREWYMPYEAHHVKLVETMDTLLQTFESDPEFRSFYLDGQTIVLDDYLQVYPEKREFIQKLCDEGKLSLGPWYILQDEFLTSSEANVRNLQIGHRDAAKFGPISKLGYFPDSFGNMGQAAQLLKQAGIDTAVFGRGVKATGFNNRVDDSGLESPFSELIWQSPDGSSVLGILFANWYNNGMEIPVDPVKAKPYWEHRLSRAEQFASTRHLLLMNGCDHQPVQTNLSDALRVARELFPDYEFVHSNFDDYVKAVDAERPDNLSVTRGELRGQQTDGWYSLVNTASARVYIKQLNQQNQTLLEKVAEPLAAAAHQLGKPYPHGLMQYAWKTLMQNHPHDSICGCSVDEVYDEMKTRFAKSMEVGKRLTEDSVRFISSRINTSSFAAHSDEAVPFAVFQTSGYEGSAVVTVEIEFAKRFFDQSEDPVAIAADVKSRTHAEGYLINGDGEAITVTAEDLGVRFGYELPNDRFRQPYMARAMRLTFEAANLPQLGYRTFAWIPALDGSGKPTPEAGLPLISGGRILENGHLKLTVEDDGSYSVYHKTSGQTFSGLGIYENAGDIGNEYIFKQPIGDKAITTKGLKAAIRVVEDTPYRASIEITHSFAIPASADERLTEEVNSMVEFRSRKAGRSNDLAPLVIVTRLSLERNGKGVRAHAAIDNQSKDHRVRVLLPSDAEGSTHFADSIFEVAERQTMPSAVWENPSNCQHLQSFIDVHDRNRGLTAAVKGLNEYEVLQDGRHTIALTLLRSVGELGDWGVFHTPDAQCLGTNVAEWMIIPYGGESERFAAYREAYRFPVPLTTAVTALQQGELPPNEQFLSWNGDGLAFSSLKINENRGDLMARWYNLSGEPSALTVQAPSASEAYISSIMEDTGGEASHLGIPVEGFKIITVGLKP